MPPETSQPTSASTHAGAGASPSLARALLLSLAALLCYANSLRAPFLLDDPQPGTPYDDSTRPLVWASFDMNRALSGQATWSYHVFNVLVHLACGLLLFGVLRRSMAYAAPKLAERTRTELAFVTALLWLCHPLQTSAVTYLSQRAESLAALFYLAVLYAFLRSLASARPMVWEVLALLALALGYASKEIIATAPLVAFLFDALFLAGGPLRALRLRPRWYVGVTLATLVLACVFVVPIFLRTDITAGLRMRAFGPLEYARTQPGVLLHYLRLVVWPHPLCFDYGWPIARTPGEYLPQSAVILALLAGTLVLCLRRSWLGFAGACFFLVLAPTSSIVPIQDPAFEHRMYLPLAAVLTVVGGGGWGLLRARPGAAKLLPVLAGAAALALAALTIRRNHDYRSAVNLLQVTVETAPGQTRARINLGEALLAEGRAQEAVDVLNEALRLEPSNGFVYANLGSAYVALGQVDRAIPLLERAVESVEYARFHDELGKALFARGDQAAAAQQFERALALEPADALLHCRLAHVLDELGRNEEALQHYAEALRLEPGLQEAHIQAAALLLELGRPSEALQHAQAAARIAPDSPEEAALLEQARTAAVRAPLGGAPPAVKGEPADALARLQQNVARNPEVADSHARLAVALAQAHRAEEALREYQEALRLAPERQDLHINLAALLSEQGRPEEALEHSLAALEILPNSAQERFNVAQALRALGRFDEAMAGFLEASRVAPELPEPYAAYAKTVGMKQDATDDERREALRLALKANEMTNSTRADFLEICAQARAALGEYAEAARVLAQALELPGPSKNQVFASRLRTQREEYLRKAGE